MKLMIFVIIINSVSVSECWDCGGGFFTRGLVFILASPSSDRYQINKSCSVHDNQYDVIEYYESIRRYPPFYPFDRRESDAEFTRCLEKCPSRYTQTVVRYGYDAMVYVNKVVTETWNKIKRAFGF
ncbi:uncharacterized protein CELE_W04G3.12 [Caenorhabditis elegans]|uniref:Uncharacterized protein n=1 Tax=Caenorhabditis elegans TaxID=6239 RepID=Q565B8_CAEEL|nr:Uncharacterized protein CELE_W04G3.12 [Caenorhabditis elegans]CAI79184.1 Uncharacterized protein CELE_W04G3.12 [Caenorhabditis elegans]|eukprot:NP_001033567.1 Uncharacterized protein CELE_W04G3.12 [Caenorhabditis elegans]